MSVSGTTITAAQINRVKTWSIFNADTTHYNWCNIALDPTADTGARNLDRTRTANKFNDLWPDPQATYTSSDTWTCPEGITEVAVECWGAGGDGGTSISAAGGGGGGGGAYARVSVLSVTPGNDYTVTVGASGGDDSWFGDTSTVLAKGGGNGGDAALVATPGAGGVGGNANHCVGDVSWSGGNGSAGSTLAPGAGGGSAGEDGDGASASGTTAGAGGLFGGASGAGSGNGTASGGGGAAAGLLSGSAGTGARGCVMIYW